MLGPNWFQVYLLQVMSKDDPPRKTYVYKVSTPVPAGWISLAVAPFEIFPDRHNSLLSHMCLPSSLSKLQNTVGFFHNAFRFVFLLFFSSWNGPYYSYPFFLSIKFSMSNSWPFDSSMSNECYISCLGHDCFILCPFYSHYEDYLSSPFPFGSYKQVFITPEMVVSSLSLGASMCIFSSQVLFDEKVIDQVSFLLHILIS